MRPKSQMAVISIGDLTSEAIPKLAQSFKEVPGVESVAFNLNGLDSPQLAAQNLFPYRSLSFPHAFSGNPGDVRTRPPLETCGGDN